MELTESLERYLGTTAALLAADGRARICDVAERMGVKLPSVVRAMAKLESLRLLKRARYGAPALTPAGRRAAAAAALRQDVLAAALRKVGVGERAATRDACRMAHGASPETVKKLQAFAASRKR